VGLLAVLISAHVGDSWDHLDVTMGHLDVTRGQLDVTWGQLDVTRSQLEVTRGHLNGILPAVCPGLDLGVPLLDGRQGVLQLKGAIMSEIKSRFTFCFIK